MTGTNHFPVVLVFADGNVAFDPDRTLLRDYLVHAYDEPLHPNPIANAYVMDTSPTARTLTSPLGLPLVQIALRVDRAYTTSEGEQVVRYVAKRIMNEDGMLGGAPLFAVEVTR